MQESQLVDFDAVFRIMEQSFPSDEYRPYEEQRALLSRHNYQILVDREQVSGRIRGFLALWTFSEFLFVEHFAVDAAFRNQGIGARMLHELIERTQKLLCLEVELPDTELAARRIAFYQRAGFALNKYPYWQPPISMGRQAVPLRIMTAPTPVSKAQFENIQALLYKEVYGVKNDFPKV